MDTALAFNPMSCTPVPRGDEDPRGKKIPPALLEEIMGNPESSRPLFRMFATTTAHEIYKEMGTYTPAQKLEATKLFVELGGMSPKKQEAAVEGGGVSITINVPSRSPVHVEAVPPVIEGDAVAVDAEAGA